MSQSAFMAWFLEQHGSRESPLWKEDDNALIDAICRGNDAQDELRRRQRWDARKESALYAWQARDSDTP